MNGLEESTCSTSATSGVSALKSAIGMAALLAWLVLSVGGGVEIARADPTQTAGNLIYQDGKAIGTAVPGGQTSCETATASRNARALALRQLVQQTAQGAAGQPTGAVDGRDHVMALNSRGYNYASPEALNRRGR